MQPNQSCCVSVQLSLYFKILVLMFLKNVMMLGPILDDLLMRAVNPLTAKIVLLISLIDWRKIGLTARIRRQLDLALTTCLSTDLNPMAITQHLIALFR